MRHNLHQITRSTITVWSIQSDNIRKAWRSCIIQLCCVFVPVFVVKVSPYMSKLTPRDPSMVHWMLKRKLFQKKVNIWIDILFYFVWVMMLLKCEINLISYWKVAAVAVLESKTFRKHVCIRWNTSHLWRKTISKKYVLYICVYIHNIFY